MTAKNSVRYPKTIPALTFDVARDGWERSSGFIKRTIPAPLLNEKKDSRDALSVLVKILYAGVCGTDRGIWEREACRELIHESLAREKKSLRILGHEFVGTVLRAGSQAENLYGVKKGDTVSGDSHVTCGRCFQCRMGEQEVCQEQKILGITTDGVFAPYVKIPAKNLWVVDFARVRPEVAALYDPFGNAVHACAKTDLSGRRVAVLGCGPIGMFTVLLCRAFGAAKIIAVDVNDANIRMAKRLGAHAVVLIGKSRKKHTDFLRPSAPYGSDKILEAAIAKLTYGKGVDVAFEMAGPNASVNNALAITRSGGEVILFGLRDGDLTIPHFSRTILKGLTLHAVIGRQIFRSWQTAQRTLSDASNGIQDKIWRIMLKQGKGTIVPFASYTPELFKDAMKRHPKILLKF